MMMLAVVFSSVINLAAGVFISMIAHFAQPPNFTVLESRMMQMTFVVKVLTLGVVVTLVNADFQFLGPTRRAPFPIPRSLLGLEDG